ncbi:hypothetical protein F2Q70_00022242, partial [Brassica cretica]
WEVNSCGYHGDDGNIYLGKGTGEAFGPTYTTGDTVGGGINYASQEFFFTKNGALVGKIPKDIKGHLFPTVAVHSQNEEVSVNFGKQKFVFDVKGYETSARNKQQMAIEKIFIPPNIGYGLVKSYLLHYGYEETLNAFNLATKTTVPPILIAQENAIDEDDLHQRKTLRKLVRNGDIDAALANLQDWYPQIVQDDKSVVCFLLHCQRFIEFVRVGKLAEGVKYGRLELAKFVGLTEFQDIIEVLMTPFNFIPFASFKQDLVQMQIDFILLVSYVDFHVDYSGLLCFACLSKARGITGGVLPRRLAEGTSC